MIILIDRSKPLDPNFIAQVGTVVENETDTRSTALTQVNVSNIRLVSVLGPDEPYIAVEEWHARVKKHYICLDVHILQTLLLSENQSPIPQRWELMNSRGELMSPPRELMNNRHVPFIRFDGTVLQSGIRRSTPCTYWSGAIWCWNFQSFEGICDGSTLSAVLDIPRFSTSSVS